VVLRTILLASVAFAAGCTSVTAPKDVAGIARPDQPPTASVTQFEQPLQCMDRLFADYGVSDVTISVSGVPDYTGKAFVGSDFWLQTAITKMSQRSRAFKVTDYNPNELQPEQGLWNLSDKAGFYIPAYYIRGAISGFADNIADNRANLGIGSGTESAAIGSSVSYSAVSVDLNIGNLVQRTLINRAHAGNEVVLESRASGAQLGGVVSKFGANVEIIAARRDGVPHAVRALVELGAIEIMGRLTATPYWECLGGSFADPAATRAREDVFHDMSDPERRAFVQRRLSVLGYFDQPVDGEASAELTAGIDAYRKDRGMPPGGLDLALYARMTDWKADQAAGRARTQEISQPAVLPLPSQPDPKAKPLDFDLVLLRPDPRPGAPVSLSLRANQSAFAYCYIQEAGGGISRIFPNRWQPDPLVKDGAETTVPGAPGSFNLVLPASGVSETVSCFASNVELGGGLPGDMQVNDLKPLPLRSLSDLTQVYKNSAAKISGALVEKQATLSPR
jgi:hypothetical protein